MCCDVAGRLVSGLWVWWGGGVVRGAGLGTVGCVLMWPVMSVSAGVLRAWHQSDFDPLVGVEGDAGQALHIGWGDLVDQCGALG